MSDHPVTVVLVGTGGYSAYYYVPRLLEGAAQGRLRLVGAVNPPELPVNEALRGAGVPLYPDLEAFFAAGRAELAILSGPIYTHCPQTLLALANGAHVLCEKPAAATLAEVQQMMAAEARSGLRVGVGFQWCFSDAIQRLKGDIQAGRFGRPLRFKSLVLWPRAQSYYGRNDWAGRVRMDDGRMVLDSPVQNATAHYLQVLLYLLGESRETSVDPGDIQAVLFRANKIENYDTAALRCRTEGGAEILFYTSHSVPQDRHPLLRLEFEEAVIEYDGMTAHRFVARLTGGEMIDYGDPGETEDNKLWDMIEAVRGGPAPACGLAASLPHVRCVEAAQRFPVSEVPTELRRVQNPQGDPLVWVEGLAERLERCFEESVLPEPLFDRTTSSRTIAG